MFVAFTAIIAAASSPAAADDGAAIVSVEARVGSGLALGGGAGESHWRAAPVTISALGELAVVTEPWTSAYGGIVVEGFGRAAAGITGGFRLRPGAGALRLAGGGLALVTPYTAFGATAGVGRCWFRGTRACFDVEGALFFAGDDVPDDQVSAQVQAVIGVAFDAY